MDPARPGARPLEGIGDGASVGTKAAAVRTGTSTGRRPRASLRARRLFHPAPTHARRPRSLPATNAPATNAPATNAPVTVHHVLQVRHRGRRLLHSAPLQVPWPRQVPRAVVAVAASRHLEAAKAPKPALPRHGVRCLSAHAPDAVKVRRVWRQPRRGRDGRA